MIGVECRDTDFTVCVLWIDTRNRRTIRLSAG
jgi:hypothetical protein